MFWKLWFPNLRIQLNFSFSNLVPQNWNQIFINFCDEFFLTWRKNKSLWFLTWAHQKPFSSKSSSLIWIFAENIEESLFSWQYCFNECSFAQCSDVKWSCNFRWWVGIYFSSDSCLLPKKSFKYLHILVWFLPFDLLPAREFIGWCCDIYCAKFYFTFYCWDRISPH